MAWPFPLMPDAVAGRCAECGYKGVVVIIFVDPAEGLWQGRTMDGVFTLLCATCAHHDGAPFFRWRLPV